MRNALWRPVTGSSRTHNWLCAGWRGVSTHFRFDGALSAAGAASLSPPGNGTCLAFLPYVAFVDCINHNIDAKGSKVIFAYENFCHIS